MVMILDAVDSASREILLCYGFDADQFASLQDRVAAGHLAPARNAVQGRIEAPDQSALTVMPAPTDESYQEAREAGLQAFSRGEVAVAVLNGGMATRFGGLVKGVVEAFDGRSFLEWKMAQVRDLSHTVGRRTPFLIMNSFATDEATREFLDRVRHKGAEPDLPEPLFFNQSVSLRLNTDGSIFIESDGRVSPYAPGHGEFSYALGSSGLIDLLRSRGVRYVMLSNVDNLGARPDPAVIGVHLREGRLMTTEVVAKLPGDVGGAPATVDGQTIIVEQFRFPRDFDQDRIGVFAVNSFVFDLDVLEPQYPLTWFYVQKDVAGRTAVQLERLVNELTSFVPSTFLQVPRTGPEGRFLPIKTPEDLTASQSLLGEVLGQPLA
jgi:UTP--glucose-1-phosphate uridylyltransferase